MINGSPDSYSPVGIWRLSGTVRRAYRVHKMAEYLEVWVERSTTKDMLANKVLS